MNTLHLKCVIPPRLDPGSRRNDNSMRRLTAKIVHVTFMEKYSTQENENNFKGLSHYFHGNVSNNLTLNNKINDLHFFTTIWT